MAIDFPNSPSLNAAHTVSGRTWIWNGTTWDAQTAAPGKYLVSDTAPSSPTTGDSWFDSTAGKFFIYYDSFWIEFGTATGPTGAPGTNGTNGTNGADGSFSSTQTIDSKSSAYTLVSGDAGKLITNSAAVTITVQGLSVGQQVDFLQLNAAQFTFAAGAGMTLVSKGSKLKTAAQYSPASIKCVATNSYVLIGDLAA